VGCLDRGTKAVSWKRERSSWLGRSKMEYTCSWLGSHSPAPHL